MGRIAQKLTNVLLQEAKQFKRTGKGFTEGLPFDLPTFEELAEELDDPQHVLFAAAQQFTSAVAEAFSMDQEFAEYAAIVGQAEDDYIPDGPPISPLTRSFFTTWAFFDVRFGADRESMGGCLLELLRAMSGPDLMVGTLEKFNASRMGIYEHVGSEGSRVRLRELLTGEEFLCHSTSGYQGHTGELWYVRLCPPVAESFDYHLVFTTPYVLTGASREDWTAFLNRSLLDASNKERGLYDLLKYGSDQVNWNEFVFQSFLHAEHDAIFLTGLPDVAGSLPHSPLRETLDDLDANISKSGIVEERLCCKLTEAQRKIIAELSPDLSARMKLAEKNERSIELTRAELDRVLESARAALVTAESFRRRVLKVVVKNLTDVIQPPTFEQLALRQPRGQWVFSPTTSGKTPARIPSKPTCTKEIRQVYQFRVELSATKPAIWRVLQVEDCTLEALHLAIQGAMGWENSHLYEFVIRGTHYTSRPPADLGWGDDLDGEDAAGVRLSELFSTNRRLQLRYIYDFGDSWEHVVTFEQTLNCTPGTKYPLCIDGARACPPEDCGGIYGYFDLVEAVTNPQSARHEELLEWCGPYDPQAFDVTAATKRMQKSRR
ncbi:MAG: plasmid pRiA4b ORF-3 family protein [Planctomycetaceae bacterium]